LDSTSLGITFDASAIGRNGREGWFVDLRSAFTSGCRPDLQGREVKPVNNRGSILQVLIIISALLGLFALQAAKPRQSVLTRG